MSTDPTWLDGLALRKGYDADGNLLASYPGIQGGRGIALYSESQRTKIGVDYTQGGYREPVVAVAHADIASLAAAVVADDFDGVTVAEGDRVALPFQTSASENGIYVVGEVSGGNAALTRATDFDAASEMVAGALFYVQGGTLWGGDVMRFITTGTITVETTSLEFRFLSGWRWAGTGTLTGGSGAAVLKAVPITDEHLAILKARVVALDTGGDLCCVHRVAAYWRTGGGGSSEKQDADLEPTVYDDAAWAVNWAANGNNADLGMTADAANNLNYLYWIADEQIPLS